MVGVLVFNVLMVLLGLGVASQVVPAKLFSGALGVLHNTIGITAPSPEKARTVALLWIGSLLVIVDGLLFLVVFLTLHSN